jgi:hypothetical protein
MEQLGQIQWKYSDPTRRIRSNVGSAKLPVAVQSANLALIQGNPMRLSATRSEVPAAMVAASCSNQLATMRGLPGFQRPSCPFKRCLRRSTVSIARGSATRISWASVDGEILRNNRTSAIVTIRAAGKRHSYQLFFNEDIDSAGDTGTVVDCQAIPCGL